MSSTNLTRHLHLIENTYKSHGLHLDACASSLWLLGIATLRGDYPRMLIAKKQFEENLAAIPETTTGDDLGAKDGETYFPRWESELLVDEARRTYPNASTLILTNPTHELVKNFLEPIVMVGHQKDYWKYTPLSMQETAREFTPFPRPEADRQG